MIRLAPLAVLALTLAACEDKAAPAAQQGNAASGEVLAGSISDAMIPLDQVTSQAPLAPRQAAQASDLDAEQPEVEPAPGINEAQAGEGAEAAPAALEPAE